MSVFRFCLWTKTFPKEHRLVLNIAASGCEWLCKSVVFFKNIHNGYRGMKLQEKQKKGQPIGWKRLNNHVDKL